MVDVLFIARPYLVCNNRRNTKKESLGFEIYICRINTVLSQIPCTCLPECFDKIWLVESILSRRPRSQLAFKNIYTDYHE